MTLARVAAAVLVCLGLLLLSPTGFADHGLQARPNPANTSHNALTVVTLNLAREADPDRILAEWRMHPSIWNADILMLQEVVHFAGERPSIAHLLAKSMNYHVASEPNLRGKNTDGLAILSRYPLGDRTVRQLHRFDLGIRSRTRIVMAATVQTPFGPVRVHNTHLDTRINAEDRLRQIEPVLAAAHAWQGPDVIAGDFNTNYLRWFRNLIPLPVSFQAKAIDRAMAARGFRTPLVNAGPTHDYFGFQLDWIYARRMRAIDTVIRPLKFSDHHAVTVRFAVDESTLAAR